ncbi:MAG: diversity-generating retroelement protein Avd [Desulfitobacteriaceae bacterium]|nr:diversity-generating retroelement protein Avd [Desulfitobacteriaceae bacterium]
MTEDLIIYQKVYDLILYAFPILNRFPKNQRFVLAQQIQNSMLEIQKKIVEANKLRNRRRLQFEIDIELDKLKLLIRLSKDLKLIDVKKYEQFTIRLTEIGRLLGGWMRSST